MKRWWIIAVSVMVLALAACGGGDDGREATPASTTAPPIGGMPGSATPTPVRAVPGPTWTPDLPAAQATAAVLGVDATLLTAGRSKPAPEAAPEVFEAPFSVGQFVRQVVRGRATAPQDAGHMAIYQGGGDTVVLNVLYMPTAAEAVTTARYALEGSHPAMRPVFLPIYSLERSFGMAQDPQGGYLAAWPNGRWGFTARADKSSAALNAFLAFFPY